MPEPITVAVVGLGEFGLQHLEAYRRNPHCEVVAVVGRDAGRTAAVAADHGVERWFTSMAEMMELVSPAAVSVVTSGAYHLEATALALDGGASVLLEKPVVLTSADGNRLLRMSESASGFVMPAHVLRFAAPYQELKRRVHGGRIGNVLSMAFRRNRTRDHDVRFPDVHPAFMTAVHDIDLAIWLSGADVVDVTSREVKPQGNNQPALVWVTVLAADDSIWSFQVSWLLPNGSSNDDTVEILGTLGTVSLDRDMVLRESTVASVEELSFAGFELTSALSAEIDYFVDCVRQGLTPEAITLREAISGIALAEQIVADQEAPSQRGTDES